MYGDVPDPVAGPGEVVVDVHAASVNAADYKVRLGGSAYSGASNLKFPYILGRDFSGMVSARRRRRQRLQARRRGVRRDGCRESRAAYAEKVKIAAAIIAKKPAKLDHAEAAAMALTSLTAIWALEDTARLKPGETVLIQGGAGGVAGFAIQLAKHIGANVITTASARNHDYVRGLGADRVIDYNTEDFTKTVSDCDVVFDTVGGEVQARSYAVLKPGGRLVWIAPAPAGFQPPRGRCRGVAPARRARPGASRTHERIARRRRGMAAGDHPLQAGRRGRGAPGQRGPPPARQAGIGRLN